MEKLKRETVVKWDVPDSFLVVLGIFSLCLSTLVWPKQPEVGRAVFTLLGLCSFAAGPGLWVYGNLRGKAVTLSDGTHAFRGWWPRLDKRFPPTTSG